MKVMDEHGKRPLSLKALINALPPDAPAVGYLATYKGKPIEYAVYAKKECKNRSGPLWSLHHVASKAVNPDCKVFTACKGAVKHFRRQATRLPGWGQHMMTDDEWADLNVLKSKHGSSHYFCGSSYQHGPYFWYYDKQGARGHMDALERKRQKTAGPLTALLVAYRLSARHGDSAALKDALRDYVQAHAADFEPRTLRAIKPAKEPLVVVRRELTDFQIAAYPEHVGRSPDWNLLYTIGLVDDSTPRCESLKWLVRQFHYLSI